MSDPDTIGLFNPDEEYKPQDDPDPQLRYLTKAAYNHAYRHALYFLEGLTLAVQFAPDVTRNAFLDLFGLRDRIPELDATWREIASLQQAVKELREVLEQLRHEAKEVGQWSEQYFAAEAQVTARMAKVEARLEAAAKFAATLKGQVTKQINKEAKSDFDVDL